MAHPSDTNLQLAARSEYRRGLFRPQLASIAIVAFEVYHDTNRDTSMNLRSPDLHIPLPVTTCKHGILAFVHALKSLINIPAPSVYITLTYVLLSIVSTMGYLTVSG